MRPHLLAALCALAATLHAASPEKPYGFDAARAALGDFQVAAGLQVELFAAEPQVQNPTNIDIDPRGRVWAVEAVNYRTTMRPWGMLRPEGDRVVILEDSNGDGAADRETTFWQSPELKAPLGICVLPQAKGTKVIVSAAPDVWLLTDADGDDRAEKAEKLFTVGGNWDHDHQVHAFVFGADGKFYFNFGNEGRELRDAQGQVITDVAGRPVKTDGKPYRQGLVFRCDIDLESARPRNVETLGWNFRNNYEVTVDSFGTMWQSDNDDDGNQAVRLNYVMQFGNYGFSDEITGAGWKVNRTNIEPEIPRRHWHLNDPGVIPNVLQTGGGSPTGILINEGSLLGPRFTNQLIHCDAGPRTVRAYPATKDGAGYRAEMIDILTSKDSWYRPSDVAIAPDGALYVSDWYDPGVGGHNMGDHQPGKIRDRIYRVAAPGTPHAAARPDFSTAESCTAALRSPNRATQYVAWRTLHSLGENAVPALQKLATDADPRLRARALGILTALPAQALAALRTGLTDADPDVRIAAIRLTWQRHKTGGLDTSDLENDPDLFAAMLNDREPQVRRELLLALHGGKGIETIWSLLAQRHDGRDRWYLEALGIAARGNEAACLDAYLESVAKSGTGWNTPAGRDIVWRVRGPQTPAILAKIAATEPEPARYLRAFDFLPASTARTEALLDLARLGAKNEFVSGEALQRLRSLDLSRNAELKAVLLAALERARGTARFVELVRDFKLRDQGAGLLQLATTHPASPEAIEAAKLLLAPSEKATLETALQGAGAAPLVSALGNSADPRSLPHLRSILLSEQREPALRQAAARALTQSPDGVKTLLDLARAGSLPEPLRLTTATALAAVSMPQHQEAIAQLFPLPQALGGATLAPIAELAQKPGDVARGRELFAREATSCVLCHRIGQLGADFGPALSEIGSKLPKEALFESIISPNAGVSMGFETIQLTMKDGSAAAGVLRSETEEEVILAMPRGVQVRYRKADIAKREKLPVSMMPSGLNQAMSAQDLIDLVAYLGTLKTAAK